MHILTKQAYVNPEITWKEVFKCDYILSLTYFKNETWLKTENLFQLRFLFWVTVKM